MPHPVTLFVDQLTVIDACYLDPRRGLLGESWIVDIELEGALNHQGMILDFGDVKKQIKQLIDEEFDHKLIIPMQYQGTQLSKTQNQSCLNFQREDGRWVKHQSPHSALCLIDAERISDQSLKDAINKKLMSILPKNISQLRITLHTEPETQNQYQYAHGLKLHLGNCQRIAHGHRSYLKITKNLKENQKLEKNWARQWTDIYIANRDDLIQETYINNIAYYHFKYTAQQGDFELSLPKQQCYLMATDSTVENIAQHIADQLKRRHPESTFIVKAFEGVRKGALGYS